MSLADPQTADGPAPVYGAAERLWRVFFSPSAVFEDIGRRPTWALCLVAVVLFTFLVQLVVLSHVDVEATTHANMEAQGRVLSDAEFETAVKISSIVFRWGIPVGSLVLSPAIMLGLAGLFYFFLKLSGSTADYMRVFSATLHAIWPPGLVAGLLAAGMAQTIEKVPAEELENLVRSHAAAFLPEDAPRWLSAMLSSIDVFNIWTLILVILGLSVAGRISRGRVAVVVLGLWGIFVLGKGALTMIFAGVGGPS